MKYCKNNNNNGLYIYSVNKKLLDCTGLKEKMVCLLKKQYLNAKNLFFDNQVFPFNLVFFDIFCFIMNYFDVLF